MTVGKKKLCGIQCIAHRLTGGYYEGYSHNTPIVIDELSSALKSLKDVVWAFDAKKLLIVILNL